MKILVTGGNGQLASEIKKISHNYNYNWIFTDYNEFDFSALDKIKSYLDKIKPNLIINCCAYTDVDKAEDHYELANILNHLSVKLIAKWSSQNNCKLLHFSTDYVYDGSSKIPIKEYDKTNPINNYGKTKLLGDIACISHNPNSIIIRTSWLYSSFGNNFVKNIINLMENNKKLDVIDDQIGSPTYAADLADLILDRIINTWKPGIYNYTNKDVISWYDFANHIKLLFGSNTVINAIRSKEYKSNTKRPKYSILDKTKIKKAYSISLIPFKDSLTKCINILKNE